MSGNALDIDYTGGLVAEPAFVVWKRTSVRGESVWIAVGSTDDQLEAEELRIERGGQLILPRGQRPDQSQRRMAR